MSFSCGRQTVDHFFHAEAQEYQDELFGKTYYFCLPQKPLEIVAGFTVANASIFTKRLPNARQKKIGQEVHHKKGMINYPAVLLAQLGVDVKYRGNHLGTQIIDFTQTRSYQEDFIMPTGIKTNFKEYTLLAELGVGTPGFRSSIFGFCLALPQ